jgi:hypothetical protein
MSAPAPSPDRPRPDLGGRAARPAGLAPAGLAPAGRAAPPDGPAPARRTVPPDGPAPVTRAAPVRAACGAGGERGQSSVELVALLPLLVLAGLALAQLLAAGLASSAASTAAGAAAMALVQATGDPEDAAREAVPSWSRGRLRVEVEGRRVEVVVRPVGLLPGLAGLLTATAHADAGPKPEGSS